MTDAASGRDLVEKSFVYLTSLSKECRKAVTTAFEQKHKGMNFSKVEPTLREEVERWFEERESNLRIQYETSSKGRTGEIIITYTGTGKGAHFKFRVSGTFTLAGSTEDPPSYMKTLNFYVDKRDFTK